MLCSTRKDPNGFPALTPIPIAGTALRFCSRNILNIDFCKPVIEAMEKVHSDKLGMEWKVRVFMFCEFGAVAVGVIASFVCRCGWRRWTLPVSVRHVLLCKVCHNRSRATFGVKFQRAPFHAREEHACLEMSAECRFCPGLAQSYRTSHKEFPCGKPTLLRPACCWQRVERD